MGYFPLCMDLHNRLILLIGDGKQIQEKAEKLRPFGGILRQMDTLTEADLTDEVVFVVIGDTPRSTAEQYSRLCKTHRFPVNVVDMPDLCSFCLPALISRGSLTISISTGGTVPAAGAVIKERISELLPENTDEILTTLQHLRQELYRRYPKETARQMLRTAIEEAFFQ